MKFNWPRDLWTRYALVISPTQIATYRTCPRQWWLRHVCKVPDRKKTTSFDFGTVLHSVCERYLKADDSGRDPATGNPMDIFPEEWETVEERGQKRRISASDAAKVRRLVGHAIDSGVLRRLPDRKVEHPISFEVNSKVAMIGTIDQFSRGIVEDHKTTGSRKYALSPKALRKDPKMLCYAEFARRGGLAVQLRLNYFVKDVNEELPTWSVEVSVTEEEIAEFWDGVLRDADEMLRIKERGIPVGSWATVEGPRVPKACSAYGGCDFVPICGKIVNPTNTSTTEQKETMASKKFFSSEASAASPAVPPALPPAVKETPPPASATPPVAPATPPVAPATPPSAATDETPPWAQPGCQACKGRGLNSKGDPCRACSVVGQRLGSPTPGQFKIWHDDQGKIRWVPALGAAPAEAGVASAPATEKAAEKMAEAKKIQPAIEEGLKKAFFGGSGGGTAVEKSKKKPKVEEPKAEVPKVDAPKVDAPKVDAPKVETPKVDAPKVETPKVETPKVEASKGFILYLKSIPLGEPYVELSTIFYQESQELAQVLGAESYFALDSWQRKDQLASRVAEVAKELEGKNVVALDGGQDQKAFLEALRPLAARVVIGVF